MKALFDQTLPLSRIAPIVVALAMAPVGSLFAQDEDVELITPESEWKYNDSGENLGTAWKEVDFDDSAWKSGLAPLGYGDPGDIATEISFGDDSSNKIITQYFRKEFTAESPGQFFSMILRVQRDDGVIIYVNGTQIIADNIPGNATFDTEATSSVDGSKERAWIETAKTTAALEAGLNVIAAEVHQSSPTSSDTRFDCQLLISKVQPEYGEVRVGIQTQFTEGDWGRERFERNPLANPPEIEINYATRWSGSGFALTTDKEIRVDADILDKNGEIDFQYFIWDATLNEWESEKIDTRNYNNVQVSVGVRTNDQDSDGEPGNGFESSDYFRGDIDISTNGVNFDTVDKWLELKGGGSKPIDWSEIVNAETARTATVPVSETEPGSEWMNPDFDDAGWISGTRGVGFDSAGGSFEDFIGINMEETMKGVNSACYIRIPFTVTNLASFTEAQLRVRYDDGYVAFINGVEVSDGNAPTPLAWNSEATSSHRDLQAVVFVDVDILDGKAIDEVLNEGENMLTIVGMNTSAGGSDFLSDVVLRVGKPGDGIPTSLDALDFGAVNRKTTYKSEVGLVPNSAASIKIRFEGKVNDDTREVIYFDDIRTLGDPIAADSFYAYMQLETGWDREDPRIEPAADPDGDGMTNLLEYAFGSLPQLSAQTTMVRGEEVSLLPEWEIKRFGFADVSYRQIAAPLAIDGNNAGEEGFHVQDIRYIAQISRGELDANGEMIWSDGTAGGEIVFEQLLGFQENEDGTVQVRLKGLRNLGGDDQTFARILVRIVGFEIDN
ncbi:MAG: hypothetical protein ACI9R3_004272 [Verrucomicrobiales bacterium]|jgi:hypothetical protein